MSGDYESHYINQPDITYIEENLMSCNLTQITLSALRESALGEISKAKANVEIYLHNPAGIGEHSDITEAIENELNIIAKYQDQIDVIQKYFKK